MFRNRSLLADWFADIANRKHSRRKLSKRTSFEAGLESLEDRVLLTSAFGKHARNDITDISADQTPNFVRGNVTDNDSVLQTSRAKKTLKVSAILNSMGQKRNIQLGSIPKFIQGKYGLLKMHANGRFVYKVFKNRAVIKALAEGEKLIDTFSYVAKNTDPGFVTAKLRIRIHGVNDAPKITSDGGGAKANIEVKENVKDVTDVSTADDADSEGAGLVYTITGGVDQSKFSIDAFTGELTFNETPDYEKPHDEDKDNVYDVRVTVTDSGGLMDSQNLCITVIDQDPPEIVSPNKDKFRFYASIEVDENTTYVADVDSTDPDGDTEGDGLTYSLTDGDDADKFQIDPNTGVLEFISAPDYENPTDSNGNNSYWVEVTVTDSTGFTDSRWIVALVQNVTEIV